MTRAIFLSILFGLLFSVYPQAVFSEEKGNYPDFSECEALRNDEAYGEKYEDYRYLIQGRDGWIFRTKQDFRQSYKTTDEATTSLKRMVAAFKKRGVDLVIAFMPTRGMAAAEFLPVDDLLAEDYDPLAAQKAYQAYLLSLEKDGILVAGAPSLKSGPGFFYKADQHWTSAGAKEMAMAAAQKIKGLDVYKDIPSLSFSTRKIKDVRFKGRFNEALEALCHTRMPDDRDEGFETVKDQDGEKEDNVDADDLFSDKNLPKIVLVGTSNSRREENDLNFSGFLQEFSSADVLNKAIAGGGLGDSLLSYIASDDFQKTPPKVIVWEVPGYYDLSSESAMAVYRQAAAAAHGPCDEAHLLGEEQIEMEEKTVLFSGLEEKYIPAGQVYISLETENPVTEKIDLSIGKTKGNPEKITFKRSKRYPPDGRFYYAPRENEADGYLKYITLKASQEAQGMMVKARLCRL